RRETHVRDRVQIVERRHDGLAELAARDLALAALHDLALDARRERFDRVGRDRSLLARPRQAGHDLRTVERLPPAVLLDDHGQRQLDALVGGEAMPAAVTVTAAPDGGAVLAEPRVHHPAVRGPAHRALHRASAEPRAVDREAGAEVVNVARDAPELAGVARRLE